VTARGGKTENDTKKMRIAKPGVDETTAKARGGTKIEVRKKDSKDRKNQKK